MPSALDGITVVDLSRVLAGPYCTMTLGDLGARVIKVEEPSKGDDTRTWGPPFKDGVASYYHGLNRNKRTMALDLGSAEGAERHRAVRPGEDPREVDDGDSIERALRHQ